MTISKPKIISLVLISHLLTQLAHADNKQSHGVEEAKKSVLKFLEDEVGLADKPRPATLEEDTKAIHESIAIIRKLQSTPDLELDWTDKEKIIQASMELTKREKLAPKIIQHYLLEALQQKTVEEEYIVRLAQLHLQLVGPSARNIAMEAVKKVDFQNLEAKAHFSKLVSLLHLMSQSADKDLLPYLDRFILANKSGGIRVGFHGSLDEILVAVFLYGSYGEGIETHLLRLLDEANDTPQKANIVGTLIYLGTPKSNAALSQLFLNSKDDKERSLSAVGLVQNGGPEGRNFLQNNSDKIKFGDKYQGYAEHIKRKMNLDLLSDENWLDDLEMANSMTINYQLSDTVVRQRLANMTKLHGRDHDTLGLSIIRSTIPKNELTESVMRVRASHFGLLSPHQVEVINISNKILQALRFREN